MWRDPALIVLAHELRASARGALAWWVVTAGMLALVCALQPSLADGALAAKLEAMPGGLRRAFGLEIVDFHRPAAYLAAHFLQVTLTVALLASRFGAHAIAKEEALRTAELLYTQPVGRARILAGKALAAAALAIAFPAALGGVAVAGLTAVAARPVEPGLVAALFAGAAALGVCFAGLGMLVATCVRDARAAAGAALAVAVGLWFVGLLAAVAPPLRWLSPYKLVEPMAILAEGRLEPWRLAALVAAGVACGALAIARYRRRDIVA